MTNERRKRAAFFLERAHQKWYAHSISTGESIIYQVDAMLEFADEQIAERDAEIARLRAYAIALRKAADPFCNIKADDNDTFNGYADSVIIRAELTVGELKTLRLSAGIGLPIAGAAINAARKEGE